MSDAATAVRPSAPSAATATLAERMAAAIVRQRDVAVPAAASEKLKTCLLDFLACAFEAHTLPWARQAQMLATDGAGPASIVGTPLSVPAPDAVFANSVAGHGLVREDMHSGSISHLGIAVLPALLALSQYRRVSGRDFIAAAVAGYEVGGQVGRAVMDAEVAKIHRPTGITGPVAAAAAGARLLGLSVEQTTSAIALGANLTVGFNQWAHTGGSEMFFHAGYAARNALSATRLAENGAFASPSALDGEAGMFASLRKRSASSKVELFKAAPETIFWTAAVATTGSTAMPAAMRSGPVRAMTRCRAATGTTVCTVRTATTNWTVVPETTACPGRPAMTR